MTIDEGSGSRGDNFVKAIANEGTAGDGKHCPKCARDIGIWPIFKAALPSSLRCPHCGARIHYADAGLVIAAMLTAVAGLSYLAYVVANKLVPENASVRLWTFCALLVAMWVPIEYAVARFLRQNRRLRADG